jgi:hypothetical protein
MWFEKRIKELGIWINQRREEREEERRQRADNKRMMLT